MIWVHSIGLLLVLAWLGSAVYDLGKGTKASQGEVIMLCAMLILDRLSGIVRELVVQLTGGGA